jgi:hypothetical protein
MTMPRGEEIVGRFGEDLLEAGFCPVPNLLLAYQDLLYLAPAEVNAIVQIWMEWWHGAEPPTVAAVAGRMGMTRRGLQKVLHTLRECDLQERAGASAPEWVPRLNGMVRQEVAAYCAQTYQEAAGPPFGYLLILPSRTSWGQKEENQYDFYPLLAYLRTLYREGVRPGRKKLQGHANPSSRAPEESFGGMRTTVRDSSEPQFASMERGKREVGEGKQQPGAAVFVVDSPSDSEQAQPNLVLDHFESRVAERWPTPADQAQPPSRARYDVARGLLSPEVSPTAVSQAPAELVEELLVLAWCLHDQEPADLAQAIDRALEMPGKRPCRQLAFAWPQVRRALEHRKALKRILRAGAALPGGDFREAARLFVCLNHFSPGPPLLERFLALCREAGAGPVRAVLERAVEGGRSFVSLAFLREGVARAAARDRPEEETATGEDVDGSGVEAEVPRQPDALDEEALPGTDCPTCGGLRYVVDQGGPPGSDPFVPCPRCSPEAAAGVAVETGSSTGSWAGRASEAELVRDWLEDYGIAEPALGRLSAGTPLAHVRAWMLYLDDQEKLTPAQRRAILVKRIQAGDEPPKRWRWVARALPILDPIEQSILEDGYEHRRWMNEWTDDVLEVVDVDVAERWVEVWRHR